MASTNLLDEQLQERIRQAPAQLIATRIKRARKTSEPQPQGLTHDQLGEKMGGVTRQHLIKLEKAVHRPRADTLRKIGEATGRQVEWFLDESMDPSPFPEEHPA
jgi:transcriptional regulator with XRE-family HTH domain